MTNLDKYRGIIPAFYACYDEKGDIDSESIKKLAKHYLDVGVKGLYVGGSSGECIYQNIEERKLVLENVVEAVGDELTIIAHIACPSTRDSVELAKHAEKLNIDALSAVPPYYFSLPEDAIEDYWTAMVEATDLDFFIYNIPQTTSYSLSIDLYERMLKLDQVKGIKNSSMPVHDIYLFNHSNSKETIIFNGPDEQFVAGRLMGADGGIGGTYGVMPELYLMADQIIKSGDVKLAKEIQYDINDIITNLTSCDGHMYAVIKEILSLNGLDIGTVRDPLPQISSADKKTIESTKELISTIIEKYKNKI